MKLLRKLPELLKLSFAKWKEDNAMRMAAALAYYTAFSLAPLLLAAISVAGLVFGQEAASNRIYDELKTGLGPSVARAIQELVQAASKPSHGILGASLAFLLVLFGASGVFGELKESLNTIWKAKPEARSGILQWLRKRFLSIGMVLGICFLLLVSLVINAGLGVAGEYGQKMMPGAATFLQIAGMIVSFGFVSALFALLFKFLPDTKVAWKDVWIGSIVTALFFTLGKSGLEIYISKSGTSSAFGAAGALALVLVWVYYSAQIFFMGAEFTAVYAAREGSRAGEAAEKVKEAATVTVKPAPSRLGPLPAPTLAKTDFGLAGIEKLKPVESAGRLAGAGIVLGITNLLNRMRNKKKPPARR